MALVNKVSQLLAQITDENWELSFLNILQLLWRAGCRRVTRRSGAAFEPGPADPGNRLPRQRAADGGPGGSTALARVSKISSTTNWVDPDDIEGNAARNAAPRELASIGDPTAARPATVKQLNEMRAPLGKRLEWVGWLRNDPKQHWECVSRGAPTRTGKLFVIVHAGNKQNLQHIGQAAAGKYTIDPASSSLVEGRPVYLAE